MQIGSGMRSVATVVIGFLAAGSLLWATPSDDAAAAAAADRFAKATDSGDLHETYRQQVGAYWKSNTAEEAWVAQMDIMRQQKRGSPKERKIIDQRALGQNPNTGEKGEFYFVRFKASYGFGTVYEDVYLEKDAAGRWKVSGFVPTRGGA